MKPLKWRMSSQQVLGVVTVGYALKRMRQHRDLLVLQGGSRQRLFYCYERPRGSVALSRLRVSSTSRRVYSIAFVPSLYINSIAIIMTKAKDFSAVNRPPSKEQITESSKHASTLFLPPPPAKPRSKLDAYSATGRRPLCKPRTQS